MFGFFRKDKPEDLMTFLKEGGPALGEGPEARVGRDTLDDSTAGIEVEEAGGSLPAELEEAAVLYANGRTGDAATLLNRYLLNHPDHRDPQPWYMLFDLYELSNQQDHFEDAAVDFAVKFERSPPTWSPRTAQAHAHSQTQPQISFGAAFGPAERARLPRFMQEAADESIVRIDVSRLQAGDDDYARAILDCLVTLQERQKVIKLSGSSALISHLNALRAEDTLSEPWWLLLMEALQLEGLQAEFEEVAIDYAVRHEVSPPSYTPPRVPPKSVASPEETHDLGSFTFVMQGVITGNDAQLAELRNFAADKLRVEVDLDQVARIDFASIGLLLDTLIGLSEKGCKVLFKEGNELVNVLLNIVGASQYAAILCRTRM